MLSETIKAATSSAHQALEKIIIGHIKNIGSQQDYKALLQLFYGYYAPLEEQLHKYFNDNNLPAYSIRRKASSIKEDLQQTGVATDNLPLCKNLPLMQNEAAAWGIMYVLEGSTLGGQHIAKMLATKASIPSHQLHFFLGYGEKGMALWQSFTNAMNGFANNTQKENEVISAATEAFEKFQQWAGTFYAQKQLREAY